MSDIRDKAFRLVSQSDVETAQRTGLVPLVEVDRADGYVHLSPSDQVLVTAVLYFVPGEPLYALEYRTDAFGQSLKWECVESRSNAFFPHLYREELNWGMAHRLHTIKWLDDGQPTWGDVRQLNSPLDTKPPD